VRRSRGKGNVSGPPCKILMATARYPPDSGGTEVHTYELAHRLAERGWQITVATTSAQRGQPSGPPELPRVLRAAAPDLVHCQGYHTLFGPLAMLAAARAGVPFVVTLHSGGHSSPLRRAFRPLQSQLLRPLLLRAGRIIAVSQFEADLFQRRLRLPRASFEVIPSGVDLPCSARAPARTGPPEVVSLGRLETYKGHGRVIAAMPDLTRRLPRIRLRILGTGRNEAALRGLAARLGVADAVEFAGVAGDQRDALAHLLERAAVVVTLSDYESQGLAIQEALALGRPALVSDGSALAELKRHENVVALPKSAGSDRIATAIVDLLGRPPTARAPHFPTWDACAAAVGRVYEDVLAERAPGRVPA
jgi:glycosyltransferase involved in cell wall biosynthesis